MNKTEFRESTMGCFYQDELREHDKTLRKALEEADALRKKEKCATAKAVEKSTKFFIRKKIEGMKKVEHGEKMTELRAYNQALNDIINIIK